MIEPEIFEESTDDLMEYGLIPIAFEVLAVLDVQVIEQGLGGFVFSMRKNESPYLKDYDSFKGEGPTRWAERWDISKWGVVSAYVGGTRVGGCVVAYDTPGLNKLEGRKDIAALWDLRVHPDCRRKGIGSALFHSAVGWAKRRSCRVLKVETQNINVPACRLYAKHGCVLGAINRYAYDQLPDEVELVWYKEL